MTSPTPISGDGGADAYARLAELGLTLPQVVPPLAAYVPAVQSGNHVYVSGQLPMVEGKLPQTGKVGAEVTPEQGAELARICGLNALAVQRHLMFRHEFEEYLQGKRTDSYSPCAPFTAPSISRAWASDVSVASPESIRAISAGRSSADSCRRQVWGIPSSPAILVTA